MGAWARRTVRAGGTAKPAEHPHSFTGFTTTGTRVPFLAFTLKP